MTVSLKHKFQSTVGDGADTSLVRPSNWNDQHDLTGSAGMALGFGPAGVAAEFPFGAMDAFTVAGLPAASVPPYRMVVVTNEAGGLVPAFNDGTNWRRVTDRAIVSAALSGTPTPLFIFIGESNSGGVGNNADATPTELAARIHPHRVERNERGLSYDLIIGDVRFMLYCLRR